MIQKVLAINFLLPKNSHNLLFIIVSIVEVFFLLDDHMQILKECWFSRLWAPWTIYARAPLYLSLTLHPLAPWPWWYRTARGPRGGWWRIHRIPSCLCLPSLQWTGKCTDLHARLSDITVCLSHHFVLFYVGTWIFKVYRWNISIKDVG